MLTKKVEFLENVVKEDLIATLEKDKAVYVENNCFVYFIEKVNSGWLYSVYQGEINFTEIEQYKKDGEKLTSGFTKVSAAKAVSELLELYEDKMV